ncbi:dienelactone hydrolase family protein [soil metagenome]
MKLLRRILFWVLTIIVLLVVVLAGSIFVDGFFAQRRLDAVTNTTIAAADGALIRAWVAKPTTPGPHPAVIMIHEFYGLRPDIVGKAEALAQEGYVVIAPNVFRGGTTNWLPRAIYQIVSADTQQIDGDVDAVFQWLATQPDVQPDRIAIMGFCFGGGTTLRYSLSNNKLAATAIFYGQPITDPTKLKAISGPVLGIYGSADQSISVESVKALEQGLTAAGVKHQISIYEGQPHAFVGSMAEIAKGGPAQQAWNQLRDFLKQNLQTSAAHTPTQALTHQQSAAGEFSLSYAVRLAWSHLVHMGHRG